MKLQTALILIAVAVAAWLLLKGSCEEPVAPALADHAGYPAYAQHCRRCHGNQGRSSKASGMAGRPVDFSTPAFADTMSVERIVRVASRGQGRMEGFQAKLSPAEMTEIARFVRELSRPATP